MDTRRSWARYEVGLIEKQSIARNIRVTPRIPNSDERPDGWIRLVC